MTRDEILNEIKKIHAAYGVTPEDVSRLTELNHELAWGDIDKKLSPRLSNLSKTIAELAKLTEATHEAQLLIESIRPVDEPEVGPE